MMNLTKITGMSIEIKMWGQHHNGVTPTIQCMSVLSCITL